MVKKTTKEIFEAQIKNGYCRRLDIVVHYLAIEHYYGKNDFGFDLCFKVHKKRMRCRSERSERRMNGFKKLISKVRKEDFNTKKYPLQVNLDAMDIVQGAHRLALALYLGVDKVCVKNVRKRRRRLDFGLKWFKSAKFDDETLALLEEKKNFIMEKLAK